MNYKCAHEGCQRTVEYMVEDRHDCGDPLCNINGWTCYLDVLGRSVGGKPAGKEALCAEHFMAALPPPPPEVAPPLPEGLAELRDGLLGCDMPDSLALLPVLVGSMPPALRTTALARIGSLVLDVIAENLVAKAKAKGLKPKKPGRFDPSSN